MKNLTNTELLRKIQDFTDEHERKKTDIIKLCRELDDIEKKYNNHMLELKIRMGSNKE